MRLNPDERDVERRWLDESPVRNRYVKIIRAFDCVHTCAAADTHIYNKDAECVTTP